MAWPVSCSAPSRPEKASLGSNFVVMRMSPGHAFGEGMLALVEAAAIEGKADRLHDLDGERPLLAGGELAGERQQGLLLLQRDHLADQRGQAARQRLEHRIDLGGGDARA